MENTVCPGKMYTGKHKKLKFIILADCTTGRKKDVGLKYKGYASVQRA